MRAETIFARYRAVLCGSTLIMVALSWPLWLDQTEFPRVPFVSGIPRLPALVSITVLIGVVISLAVGAIGRLGTPCLSACLIFLSIAVVQDQNRLQPWVYQYLVVGLALATASKATALWMARWYTVGLYFYSGLSKVDASFCRELGPRFLVGALGPLGLHPEEWSVPVQSVGSLAMPGFEWILAALLVCRRTRKWGLVASVFLHGSLLWILGPWNLDHSPTVLAWNLAQIVENILLFGISEEPGIDEPKSRTAWLAWLIFGPAMVLPAVERLRLFDAWPGHALYASHAERSDIYLHEDEIDRFPEAIRKRLAPPDASSWRRLDLTGWSRDVRGTPLYPSGRVGNAVAEFLETHHGGLQPVRLIQWGRASIWEGRRDRDESVGLKAIRRRGERFLLNAHPTP